MPESPTVPNSAEIELRQTIRELTGAVQTLSQQLAVHNAEQKQLENMVLKHEKVLYEDNGLIAKSDRHERALENINKAAWAFFAPFLAFVLIGILLAALGAVGVKTP